MKKIDELIDEIRNTDPDVFYEALNVGGCHHRELDLDCCIWELYNVYKDYSYSSGMRLTLTDMYELKKLCEENVDKIERAIVELHMEYFMNQWVEDNDFDEDGNDAYEQFTEDAMADFSFDWYSIVYFLAYGGDFERQLRIDNDEQYYTQDDYDKWLKNYDRRVKLKKIEVYGE